MKTTIKITILNIGLLFGMNPFVGSAQTGPGGVGSTDGSSELELWLLSTQVDNSEELVGSDLITYVESWPDQSGNGNNMLAYESHPVDARDTRPWFTSNVFNGWPAIEFLDEPSFLEGPSSGIILGGDGDTESTLYAVFKRESLFSGGYVLSLKSTDNNNNQSLLAITQNLETTGSYDIDGPVGAAIKEDVSFNLEYFADDNGGSGSYGGNGGYGNDDIIAGLLSKPLENSSMYVNGNEVSDLVTDPIQILSSINGTGADAFTIGSRDLTSNTFMRGYLAEAIIFSRRLNAAERVILENYLGAKYNIAIAEDYYDHESTYYFDVAGIGQTSAEKHTTSSSSLITVNSNNMEVDDSFLFIGHDSASVSSFTTNDLPLSNSIGLDRVWRLELTNVSNDEEFVFDVDMGALPSPVNANYDTYYLLTSASSAFDDLSNSSFYELDASGQVTINNAELVSGQNYLKIVAAAPLNSPQNFEAQSDLYERVLLTWDAVSTDVTNNSVNPPDELGYNVYMDTGSGMSLIQTTSNTYLNVSGLTNGQSYDFEITASMNPISEIESSVATASATPGLIIGWDTDQLFYNSAEDRYELRINESEANTITLDVSISDDISGITATVDYDFSTPTSVSSLNSLRTLPFPNTIVRIDNAGSGYSIGEQFTEPTGGAIIQVDNIDGSGGITNFSIVNGGLGYPFVVSGFNFTENDGNGGENAQFNLAIQAGMDYSWNVTGTQTIGDVTNPSSVTYSFVENGQTGDFTFDPDEDVESDEEIIISITNITPSGMGSFTPTLQNETVYVILIDDENTRKIHFPQSSMTVTEPLVSTTLVSVPVEIPSSSVDTMNDTEATYIVANYSTATNPDDHNINVVSGGTITIPSNETSADITFSVPADSEYDPNESIFLRLIDPVNSSLGDNPASDIYNEIEIIIEDDTKPTLQFDEIEYWVDENVSSGILDVTINSDIPASDDYTVHIYFGTGSTTQGVDYSIPGTTVTFPAGALSAAYQLTILDDNIYEGQEQIVVRIEENASYGYEIVDLLNNTTIVYIDENDPAPVASFSSTQTYLEEESASVTIVVTQDAKSSIDNDITYTIAESPRISSGDYTDVSSGTVTISAGETTASIQLDIIEDAEIEGLEYLTYTLGSSSIGSINASAEEHIFTIIDDETGHLGPGGVGNPVNNTLWLRADKGAYADAGSTTETSDGDDVYVWQDQSGNGLDFSSSSFPMFMSSVTAFNEMPGIQFERGTSDYLTGPRSHALTGFSNSDLTVFMIFKHNDQTNTEGPLLRIYDDLGSSLFAASVNRHNGTTDAGWVSVLTNDATVWLGDQSSGTYDNDTPLLFMADVTSGAKKLYLQGSQVASSSSYGITGQSNHLQEALIGRSGSSYFDGEIAEVIIYNKRLNDLERVIVEHALAAKYGMLAQLPATFIPTSTSAFTNKVAGIGNDGTNEHNIAQGASTLMVSNPSSLDAGDYLFWGENGLIGKETTDVPTGIDNRYKNVWQFHETNDVGTVDLVFYHPIDEGAGQFPEDIGLLEDADGTFSDATRLPIVPTYDAVNGLFTFPGVDIQDSYHYTIASTHSRTPLPVTLTSYSLTEENGVVSIDWTVATEINNEGFEIERSTDGKSWKIIGFVQGAGTTSFPTQYTLDDPNPHAPISYYRCVQKDFDGTEEVIFVDRIDLGQNQIDQDHIIYPNPVINGEINILIGSGQPEKISLHSPSGQPLNYRVIEETDQRIRLKLDQTGYPFFVLSIMNIDGSVERRIILNDIRN